MIYGIGCDIVDIHRFEKYVDDKKRLEKLYTENELNEFYKITNATTVESVWLIVKCVIKSLYSI